MAGSPNVLAQVGENVKNVIVRRVIWALVVLVIGGVSYGVKWALGNFNKPNNAAAVAVAPPAPEDESAAPAPNPGVTVTPAAPNAAAQPAATKAPNDVKVAATDGTGAPVVTAVPQPNQAPGSSLAHLDEHLTYQYNALGRRDPFQSLVDGNFVGVDVGGDAPPDPGGIKVVGIVWGAEDQFALVEDVRGNSFVLRKGDKVQNGVVEGLKRDALIVNITAEGQSQSVEIPLVRKGDQNAR